MNRSAMQGIGWPQAPAVAMPSPKQGGHIMMVGRIADSYSLSIVKPCHRETGQLPLICNLVIHRIPMA